MTTTPPAPPTPSPTPTPAPPAADNQPTPNGPAGQGTPEAGAGGTKPQETPTPQGGGTESKPDDGKVSSGDEAGAATSRSGESTSLHENLRQAQHLVDGDLVGNKFVFLLGSEDPVQLRVLPRQLRETVRRAFVNPEGWDDLRLRFSQRRAIILRGRPGRGRTATAIRLLQSTRTETVFDLDPKVDLARLGAAIADRDASDRPRSAGYLLCQASDANQLRGWLLQGLEEILERHDARLVLTVGADVPLDHDDDLGRYVIDLLTPPSIQDILAGHLRWRRGEDEAEQLLAHVPLKEFVETYLVADSSFEITAQLAEWIGHEPIDAVDVERIRSRLARRRDGFEVWFDGLPDLGARTFAIALAVLDGLPTEDISAAARSLYRRLDTSKQIEFDQAPTRRGQDGDPFGVTVRQRLVQLQAFVHEGTARRGLSLMPATVMSFRDRDYAKKTIERVWQDYQIQDVLLDWLAELLHNPSEQVRVFAATALGVISTLSFDYVVGRVLRPAAESKSRLRRQGVAVALRVVAEEPRLLPAVRTLVSGWYGDSNPNLQATAAHTYGLAPRLSGDGPDPIASVRALDRLATTESIVVAVAIGESLASLIVADNLRVAPTVYATLLSWFDDHKRAGPGHLAFLLVAAGLITVVGESDPAKPPTSWPTLLLLARNHPELREPLFTLWHRVLDEAVMQAEADGVLTTWAGLAETDSDLREAFVRMVRVVASRNARTRQSLLRLAEEWISEERIQPLSTVSAAIITVVRQSR